MEEMLSGLNKNLQKIKVHLRKMSWKMMSQMRKNSCMSGNKKLIFDCMLDNWKCLLVINKNVVIAHLEAIFPLSYLVCIQYNLQLTISWQLNTIEMNNAYLPNHAIWYNFKATHIIIDATIILRPHQQRINLRKTFRKYFVY